MSEMESGDTKTNIKPKEKEDIFKILAILTVGCWIFAMFIIGFIIYSQCFTATGYCPNGDAILINTMSSLFAVGSFLTGISLGFVAKEFKSTLLITILATVVSAGVLSIIAGIGSSIPIEDYTVLIWSGVGGSAATLFLISLLVYSIRILVKSSKIKSTK
ncbi:MAG: hypothetical protein FK733_18725 [Asgard group archaeon]|nr:hypothetical protein [Asgard group archaeon]